MVNHRLSAIHPVYYCQVQAPIPMVWYTHHVMITEYPSCDAQYNNIVYHKNYNNMMIDATCHLCE